MPDAMPANGPAMSGASWTIRMLLGRGGRSWSAFPAATTGPTTLLTILAIRWRRNSSPHWSQALGEPILRLSPPQSTMPPTLRLGAFKWVLLTGVLTEPCSVNTVSPLIRESLLVPTLPGTVGQGYSSIKDGVRGWGGMRGVTRANRMAVHNASDCEISSCDRCASVRHHFFCR